MPDPASQVTRILSAVGRGEADSEAQLLAMVYEELRHLARGKMAGEGSGQTLQATALVHEAYVRMFAGETPTFQNRKHFFHAAATAMKRILIERARRVGAEKRGGGRERVPMQDLPVDGAPSVDTAPSVDILALGDAIELLELESPRAAFVVRLRYFIGLSIEETAEVLNVSTATVRADWTMSKAWLRVRLEKDRD